MRLKAKSLLTYAGKEFVPGMLFDAPERDGRELISRDEAEPFNLEDPSQRTLAGALANLAPAMPAVPPVTITPTSDTQDALGGTGSFEVAVTGPGESGTWTVDKDASATWLTVTAPLTPQTVDGPVDYNVSSNLGAERAANMYINGKTFTVTQAGV